MSKITRRQFIKTGISSAVFLYWMQPWQAFGQLSRKKAVNSPPLWRDLVEKARWCPTVHNLQPHQLKIVSEYEAELYYDPKRLLPVGDPESIFTTIALGIFIEHLKIAASANSFTLTISDLNDTVDVSKTESTFLCKLTLTETDVKETIDPSWIHKRRTSRGNYNGAPLNDSLLVKMKETALKYNHEFFYSNQTETTDLIIQLNQETLFEDLDNEPIRSELDHLFRYNKQEAETNKDGLWAKCMGFSGKLMRSVFQKHEKWEDGLRRKMLARHYKNSFEGTKTICWFGGKIDTTEERLYAGMMLARNWLLLTGDGAYLHPFGSLITNERAYKKINEKLTIPAEGKKIWMLFRAGYSDEPTPSFRLDTDQIILK